MKVHLFARSASALFTAGFFLISFMVAACAPSQPAPSQAQAAAGAPAAQPQAAAAPPALAPYKIAILQPLTGPLASFTQYQNAAMEVAAAEINGKGGVKGHPIELVFEDTKGSPEAGVSAFRKVVDVDKVQAVVTNFTNVVTAQISVADQLKVPFLAQTQTPGLMARGEYSFAHAPTAAQSFPLLGDHWKVLGVKRLFAFYPDNALAEFLSPSAQETVRAIGAEYGEARFKLGETDYRGVVARAKDFRPDVILIFSQATAEDGLLIKQMRELGVTAPIHYGFNAFETQTWREVVGPYVEGITFAGVFLEWNNPDSKEFIEAYRAKTGKEPAENESESYDIIKMFAYAIEQKGYDGEAIRQVLENLRDFPTVTGGTVSMSEDHQSSPPIFLSKVKDGKLVRISPGG